MKIKLMLVVLLASFVVIAGGTVITVYFTHPRDDAAYLSNLHKFSKGDGWDKAFAVQTDGYFLMQGEDACTWLKDQGLALWRTDEWFQLDALTKRYAETTDEQDADLWDGLRGAKAARRQIARFAFVDICGATYEFHRPHNFSR